MANIDHAADQGATSGATAICGDGQRIDELVSSDVHGHASLVLTSRPYGDSVHGQVRTTRDPGNLAHRSLEGLMSGFTEILTGCRKLLKPDGFPAITARPIRRHGAPVDIPTMALAAAVDAGLPRGSAASRCWHASATTG